LTGTPWKSGGQFITPAQLAAGIAGIDKVAAALGGRMEIMIDAHAVEPGCAMQIVRAAGGFPVRC